MNKQSIKLRDIPRVPVVSSNIKSVGYQDGILTVEFGSNSVYAYINVPEDHFKAMTDRYCESVGKYFAKNVKNAYTCIKG